MFAVPFEQIAPILGRSEVATRQLASRARRRLREPEPREDLAAADAAVVDAFMQASRDNDFAALLELLDPEASRARRRRGAGDGLATPGRSRVEQAVAEFFAGRARAALPATLDGAAAASWQHLGEVKVVFGFTVVDGKVVQIEVLADPRRAHACGPTLTGPIVSVASASTISPSRATCSPSCGDPRLRTAGAAARR